MKKRALFNTSFGPCKPSIFATRQIDWNAGATRLAALPYSGLNTALEHGKQGQQKPHKK
jgi:hypothetical protein